jgi:predicted enzyme related to lactoylglutathione lyase
MEPTPALFCHVEIRVRDLDRARAFYGRTLGWSCTAASPSFDWIATGALPDASLLRVVEKRDCGVVCFVRVDDVRIVVQRALATGGKVLTPPREEPGHCLYAILADPDGNAIGVWERVDGVAPA